VCGRQLQDAELEGESRNSVTERWDNRASWSMIEGVVFCVKRLTRRTCELGSVNLPTSTSSYRNFNSSWILPERQRWRHVEWILYLIWNVVWRSRACASTLLGSQSWAVLDGVTSQILLKSGTAWHIRKATLSAKYPKMSSLYIWRALSGLFNTPCSRRAV